MPARLQAGFSHSFLLKPSLPLPATTNIDCVIGLAPAAIGAVSSLDSELIAASSSSSLLIRRARLSFLHKIPVLGK